MELKRILARDARAANEKAIAMYGPDVLVISSCQVRGQTELIVAVDIDPLTPEEAVQEEFTPSMPKADKQVKTGFTEVLGETLEQQRKIEKPSQAQEHQMQAQHDALRGREIVDMVRDELAALRKEFRISQQMSMWQAGGAWPAALQPLRTALQETPIPAALRALLLDSVQGFDALEPALAEIRQQLVHAIKSTEADALEQGVHVFAGASGAGKTMMVSRWAQHAASKLGHEQVAVVSFSDLRPGAWNQMQLLCAQSGVECFRATNPAMLQLLLDELSSRTLILIDTPGVQMHERLKEISNVSPKAEFHAVVSAEASVTTLHRLLQIQGVSWKSLMISKIDEATQPWALMQFLTEGHMSVSAVSRGDRMMDWQRQFDQQELVNLAIAHLPLPQADAATADLHFAMARASARIAQLTSQQTGGTT
jgi:flagellar biosynthesis protein FlhF